MCGITGWLSHDGDTARRKDAIVVMTATMKCRGPDESGTWVRPQVALGHRRLAIIDLPGGKQPMSVNTSTGEIAMIYSGEVYNFTELRESLRKQGHRFHSDSDTEVVLRGYLEWGLDVVHHLNGMFAMAIWDGRKRSLILIRDRLGVKPLYYYPTSDGVLFGSEPKAILAHPWARAVVDTDGFRELIELTQVPGGSLWKGMESVEPGSFIVFDDSGMRPHTYWKLTTKQHDDDRVSTVEAVRRILTDTVHRQLIADVPQCVLLSGGLDSSSITGIAAAHLAGQEERLRTFSVDFTNRDRTFMPDRMYASPDAPFAQEMAQLVASQHNDVLIDAVEIADPTVRRAAIVARDAPTFGQLDRSLYLLFKKISENSTVAISGESADELFGGYYWFHDEAYTSASTFPWLAASLGFADSRAPSLRNDVRDGLDLTTYVADQYSAAISQIEYMDGETDQERRMRKVSFLALQRFVRRWLDRKDRISMAVGLEVRVPFCDHQLVEYVYNAPWRFKSFDGREKSLLRHAAGHVLPSSIVNRVKSAYPLTQDPGYWQLLQIQAKELLAERSNPVFSIVSEEWLQKAVTSDYSDSSNRATGVTIAGIEWTLDLYHWFDLYRPTIVLD